MTISSRTRLAVLGTLSDLHREPLAYDLACLRALLAELSPDLLCAEITREAWEGGDLSSAALDVREALAPVAAATDIVLVPVLTTPQYFADFTPAAGWRRELVRAFDHTLQWAERQAGRPEAVNGTLFGAFCHTLCWLSESLWTTEDRMAWEAQNKAMAENILLTVQRDPGLRVLVTLHCQRLHVLLSLLRAHSDDLEIVDYREL